ncbi:hypothetical protein GCM10010492_19050 [Saccharothrix mutabilis subsp. mutabilis]|uniref:Alpha/beta hydrolase domain-containing protein n=1 Tax=Saccharothrix mutabilis subsp. mutabilis TaxID=66855 RepID=A0ABP3D1R6_9PSEU
MPLRHVGPLALALALLFPAPTPAAATPEATAPAAAAPTATASAAPARLALGGVRLSQVAAPRALNTGDNSGEAFCRLFGTHVPFDADTLKRLYPTHGHHVHRVVTTDAANVRAGYLLPADARANLREVTR